MPPLKIDRYAGICKQRIIGKYGLLPEYCHFFVKHDSLAHGVQKVRIRFGLAHFIEQEFHSVNRA